MRLLAAFINPLFYIKYTEKTGQPRSARKKFEFPFLCLLESPLAQWSPTLKYAQPGNELAVVCVDNIKVAGKAQIAAANLDRVFKRHPVQPVLISPQTDFSFYIQLGWLVEYLPQGSGPFSYFFSKLRHLASRYINDIFMPLDAGLQEQEKLEKLFLDLLARKDKN